jgi:hypothetical protein
MAGIDGPEIDRLVCVLVVSVCVLCAVYSGTCSLAKVWSMVCNISWAALGCLACPHPSAYLAPLVN